MKINLENIDEKLQFPMMRFVPQNKTQKIRIEEDYYFFMPYHFIVSGINYQNIYIKIPKNTTIASPCKILIGAIFKDYFYKKCGIQLAVWYKEINEFHDLEFAKMTRKEADRICYILNLYTTEKQKTSFIAYLILRCFGSFAWKK